MQKNLTSTSNVTPILFDCNILDNIEFRFTEINLVYVF